MAQASAMTEPALPADPAQFRADVVERYRPVVFPGAVRDWPLLASGDAGVLSHLREQDTGKTAEMFVSAPGVDHQYYYDEALSGFTFARETLTVSQGLDRIIAAAKGETSESCYLGSLPADSHFSEVGALVPLPCVPPTVVPRMWIGNASRIACHYDTQDNIACVAVGRRRFTLYPPEAVADIYVGPIDFTMAGQPVGLAVESARGDDRYPRFEAIRDSALVFELEAGDAIYVPKLWWHKVEGLDPLNVLVNFWWDSTAAGNDAPYAALLLSMIAIAERPAAERAAWRAFFDHYAFRPDGHPLGFLPESRRGILRTLGEGNYQRIRTTVMRMLRGM